LVQWINLGHWINLVQWIDLGHWINLRHRINIWLRHRINIWLRLRGCDRERLLEDGESIGRAGHKGAEAEVWSGTAGDYGLAVRPFTAAAALLDDVVGDHRWRRLRRRQRRG
jgi:hypothetical protein